jgi:hypothetical protein
MRVRLFGFGPRRVTSPCTSQAGRCDLLLRDLLLRDITLRDLLVRDLPLRGLPLCSSPQRRWMSTAPGQCAPMMIMEQMMKRRSTCVVIIAVITIGVQNAEGVLWEVVHLKSSRGVHL